MLPRGTRGGGGGGWMRVLSRHPLCAHRYASFLGCLFHKITSGAPLYFWLDDDEIECEAEDQVVAGQNGEEIASARGGEH